MKKFSIETLTVVLFLLFVASAIHGQLGVNNYDERSYLIRFDEGATESEIELVRNEMQSTELWVSPLTQTRKWTLNAELEFPYYNAVLDTEILDINEQRDATASRADVDQADLNFFYAVDPTGNGGAGNAQNHCYETIDQNSRETTNITIAILDTGFAGSKFGVTPTSKWNYVDGNNNVADPNGHGTHIYSIIEDTYMKNTGLHPNNLNWDIRKTHNSDGIAELANIILALEEAVVDGADIINMSTSYYDTENVEQQLVVRNVIEVIEQNNVLVVVSAGNEESELDLGHEPNCFPTEFEVYNILSVGAYDCEDQELAGYSNYGTYSVDITAPGSNIIGYEGKNLTSTFKSGTSQATAIVTGVAAVLGENQNAFDYVEVKCAILSGADTKTSLSNKVLTSGFLNADEALQGLLAGCNDIFDAPDQQGTQRTNQLKETVMATIYPNPTADLLSLYFDYNQELVRIKIMDTRGQLLRKTQYTDIQSVEIDIADLSDGLYFMQYESAGEIVSKSFVKN